METLAPIALFVYNRPEHTRRTLRALATNALAQESQLYIFADGPKHQATAAERERIEATRAVLREEQWCGAVTIREQPANLGLAESIIRGVTEVVQRHGRIIVLEDDLVTSPAFLRFMNAGLDAYAGEPRVMHVSGFYPPADRPVPEAFFLPHMMCYGWGTWADAWARFEPSAERLWAQVRRLPWRERYRYQLEGGQNYLKMLQDLRHGNNSSWAIRWATALYLQGGLGLYPGQGYVRNIGFDGSGANTAAVDAFANFPLNDRVPALEHLPLEVNEAGRQAMNAFFRRTRQNVLPLWVTDFLYLYGPYKGLQALQKLKASAFS